MRALLRRGRPVVGLLFCSLLACQSPRAPGTLLDQDGLVPPSGEVSPPDSPTVSEPDPGSEPAEVYDGPPCGDGLCALQETPCSCPADCQVEVCGNGICCDDTGENSGTCPVDCGVICGDGACNGWERTCTCPEDCGVESCGNEVCCKQTGEDGQTCPQDCGTVCGDGGCDGGETPCGCPVDCGQEYCGNSYCCPAKGEKPVICGKDCP